MPILDAFPHILPAALFDQMTAAAQSSAARSWLEGSRAQTGLFDLNVRFRVMDAIGDYQQALTLGTPPIEQIATGSTGRDLAQLANDSLAELCQQHPDRFVGFAAGLPMDNPEAALTELDRAMSLGALGVQIFTNVNGHALDEPRFDPLFARMATLDKPIWVHGARSFTLPEFVGDEESKYALWLALGWPYEMSLFMARLVLAGILDRYPNLRILTHHGGGMIPTFGQRVGTNPLNFQGPEHAPERDAFGKLKKPTLEYFKMFYADTTVGAVARTISASLDFFGTQHVLFGSDWPYGPPTDGQQGNLSATLRVLRELGLPPSDLDQVLGGNARRVLLGIATP